jgi:hypothetical protein
VIGLVLPIAHRVRCDLLADTCRMIFTSLKKSTRERARRFEGGAAEVDQTGNHLLKGRKQSDQACGDRLRTLGAESCSRS